MRMTAGGHAAIGLHLMEPRGMMPFCSAVAATRCAMAEGGAGAGAGARWERRLATRSAAGRLCTPHHAARGLLPDGCLIPSPQPGLREAPLACLGPHDTARDDRATRRPVASVQLTDAWPGYLAPTCSLWPQG